MEKLPQTLIFMDFLKYLKAMKELEDMEPNVELFPKVSEDPEADPHCYKKALHERMMARMQ
jgi:hypothetical protein